MKKMFAIISACFLLVSSFSLMSSCSNIDEDARLMENYETVVSDTIITPVVNDGPYMSFLATVLVEDFTSQKCTFCPEGTRLLEEARAIYGEHRVIPVAIHSGKLGVMAPKGLMTELGQYYWDKNGFNDKTAQPTAVFNRHITFDDKTFWQSTIATETQGVSMVALNAQNCVLDGNKISFDLYMKAKSTVDGNKVNLQFWLIENGIVATQIDGGTSVKDYVHNHVLREALNGNDGESITLSSELTKMPFSFTIDDNKYKPENCNVVAFVYDDSRVLQTQLIMFSPAQ